MKGRKAKEKPSDAELMAFAKKWHYINLTGRAKAEYHVGYDTAKKWLTEAGLLAKQTPPEPPATNQSAQDATEPVKEIIAEKEITVKDVLLYEIERQEASYTPADNDYDEREDETRGEYTAPLMGERAEREDAPQRTTLTSARYDAMLNDTEERQTALQIYLENQSYQSLLKRWAGEVFEHSGLSIEKKLELTRQLLDWGAEA